MLEDAVKKKRQKHLKIVSGVRLPDFNVIDPSNPEYNSEIIAAYNYVNYVYDTKETAVFARDYAKDKLNIDLSDVPDSELITIGQFAWINLHGGVLSEGFTLDKTAEIGALYKRYKVQPEDTAANSAANLKRSEMIVKQQTSKLIGELEGLIDDTVFHKLGDATKSVRFWIESLPKAELAKVKQYFDRIFADECTEGLSLEEVILLNKIQKEIATSLKSALITSVATRAPRKTRKPKKITPEKQVKGLKYLPSEPTLKLQSLNPTRILGAEVLWIYNTKYRKLGKYVAADAKKGLSVKGSAIIGFDEMTSVAKTLRKPKEQLTALLACGKVEQRKFLEGIKTAEAKLNGRITKEVILLKLY